MRKTQCIFLLAIVGTFSAVAADDTVARLGKALAVLNAMTESGHGIQAATDRSAPTTLLSFWIRKRAPRLSALWLRARVYFLPEQQQSWSAPGMIYT